MEPTKSSLAALIMEASQGAAPKVAEAIVYLKPIAKPIGFIATMIIDYCGPLYIKLFQLGYRLYHELPTDLLSALIGLGLSFCGGAYCASISAIQAVRMSGWDRTQSALEEVYTDVCVMYKAYVEEDSTNADDLLTRKLAVVAVAVKDPEQLSAALGGLYTSWLAVQAVLRIEFAKTITLGVSIAAMATPYLQKVGLPVLVHVMPPAYHHWIPMLIANTARSIGVAVAWKMQEVVSAMHLALLGGLLFSRSILRWARRQGYALPAAEDTVLDEVAGYAVAALGFYYQYAWGFALPFPLSLLFFPLGWIEWYIRWAVTSTPAIA
jgi:hypothetical protein